MSKHKRDKDGFVELKRITNSAGSIGSHDSTIAALQSRIRELERTIRRQETEIDSLRMEVKTNQELIENYEELLDKSNKQADELLTMMEKYEEELSSRSGVSSDFAPGSYLVRQPSRLTSGFGVSVNKDGDVKSYRLSDGEPILQPREFDSAEFEIQPGRGFHIGINLKSKKKK